MIIPICPYSKEMSQVKDVLYKLIALNRRMEVDVALANITRLARLDTIHLHVDLILGLPHETAESFRNSFNRVFATRHRQHRRGLLSLLPAGVDHRSCQAQPGGIAGGLKGGFFHIS